MDPELLALEEQRQALRKKVEREFSEYKSLVTDADSLLDAVAQSSPSDAQNVSMIRRLEHVLRSTADLKILTQEQWNELAAQMEGYYDKIKGGQDAESGVAAVYKLQQIGAAERRVIEVMAKFDALTAKVMGGAAQKLGAEQVANGKEREADEVGYELYLRARMVPQEFYAAWGLLIASGAPTAMNGPFVY